MELNCKTEAHVAETIAAPACTTLVFDQEFYTSIFGIEFGGGHDGHDPRINQIVAARLRWSSTH